MTLFHRILTALGVLIAALLLAAGSAWWLVLHPPSAHGIAIGPWRSSSDIGSEHAGMYLRANVAVTGLFALNRSEAIYFFAGTDDSGTPLEARCTYAIEGTPVAARWWSITAYGDDNFLIPNAANRFSFNMGTLDPGADGRFKLTAAPSEQPGAWLPTGGGTGGFNLTFRIYNAAPAVLARIGDIALPSIKRVGGCT